VSARVLMSSPPYVFTYFAVTTKCPRRFLA
jgi:hypothetical protein